MLVSRGRLDEADRVVSALETRGHEVDPCRTPLAAARCRALILAARREPAAPDASRALTATELRVVELVASGLNDRAIASLLSLSPTAVAANLLRVYDKLGISTRERLGAADREVSRLR